MNKKGNEKGSITLFVILGIILFAITLFSTYGAIRNKNIAQKKEIEKIQRDYQASEEQMQKKYEELTK